MRPWLSSAAARIVEQGPCGICGGPYAAHRMIDTQMECVSAGDSLEAVAADCGTTVADMVTSWCALIDLLYDAAVEALEVS